MATADRDYWRNDGNRAPGSPGGRLTPVVRWLIGLNVAVFLADLLVLDHLLARHGSFSVRDGLLGGRIWELLTFQFIHAGLGHLAFNMVGLWIFGPVVERWWGSRRFAVFYLACGVAGALCFSVLCAVGLFSGSGIDTHDVGASAGIYGVLLGVAVIAPETRVMLIFPPIETSMRQLAMLVMGIAVIAVLTGLGGNAGGEAGHLGGALLGWMLMRHPHWLNWAIGRDPEVEIIPPKVFSRRRSDAAVREEVDRILDKISEHGMHSLTRAEKRTLERVSQTRNSPP
ncbi:MAG: rhomboid family intramembrane serine protease [Verrucomicrobia bacterium]|nr:rhomboid family intramembrane serine protease [Verrucomicrobiota bacterium]